MAPNAHTLSLMGPTPGETVGGRVCLVSHLERFVQMRVPLCSGGCNRKGGAAPEQVVGEV